MLSQELINKYERENTNDIKELEEKEGRQQRIKELEKTLIQTLKELDKLRASVYYDGWRERVDLLYDYRDIIVKG